MPHSDRYFTMFFASLKTLLFLSLLAAVIWPGAAQAQGIDQRLIPPAPIPSAPPGPPTSVLPPGAVLPGQPAFPALPPGGGSGAFPGLNAPVLQEQPSGSPLRLSATLTEDSAPLAFGVVWRVFGAAPGEDGEHPLVEKTDQATPVLYLPPGDYIVHAAYGRAHTAEQLTMGGAAAEKNVNLNAGGLRLALDLGRGETALPQNVSMSVYSSEQDEYGERRLIVPRAELNKVIRLEVGTYHIYSQYGGANAVVRADVKVEPGKITDATVVHHAGVITLKLVYEPGGEALANTAWSVLTPGGDVVSESMGAFPTYILAEGEYEAIARHEGQIYNRTFTVEPGIDREVELLAR